MKITLLSTTLRESEFLEPMSLFAERAAERGHDCVLVRYGEIGLRLSSTAEVSIWGEGAAALQQADVIVPRLSLRRMTRNELYLLEYLEETGVPFINSIAAWQLARNKLSALNRCRQAGLPVPATVVVRQLDQLAAAVRHLGAGPWVVKPAMGSQGRDISLVKTLDELAREFAGRWEEDRNEILLLQEFLAAAGGRSWDLRVFVLLGEVLGAMKRISVADDFRANYSLGAIIEPAPLSDELKQLARQAAAVLDLDMAGVDMMLPQRGPVLIEVNANPGWEGITGAMAEAGQDFPTAFLEVLERHFGPA
ncbi:MAG: RimK family alpha-L-glutamate ligase [Acidobacteria bacterium]|nr:RimK family alpha-L-glutamate ligase [Acidobacteriota bacterium]